MILGGIRMAETDFLESVLKSEGVAGEMVFNAKAARKEAIDRAKAQSDEIIAGAKTQALENHRRCMTDASEEASGIMRDVTSDAMKEAELLRVSSGSRSLKAAVKTAEGIVKIFADS
jgi:vacuolar-type H+-ATPase subunit H